LPPFVGGDGAAKLAVAPPARIPAVTTATRTRFGLDTMASAPFPETRTPYVNPCTPFSAAVQALLCVLVTLISRPWTWGAVENFGGGFVSRPNPERAHRTFLFCTADGAHRADRAVGPPEGAI
jgi:hypothetical protein